MKSFREFVNEKEKSLPGDLDRDLTFQECWTRLDDKDRNLVYQSAKQQADAFCNVNSSNWNIEFKGSSKSNWPLHKSYDKTYLSVDDIASIFISKLVEIKNPILKSETVRKVGDSILYAWITKTQGTVYNPALKELEGKCSKYRKDETTSLKEFDKMVKDHNWGKSLKVELNRTTKLKEANGDTYPFDKVFKTILHTIVTEIRASDPKKYTERGILS